MSEEGHPARRLPLDERVAYLSAVASIACADHAVSDVELAKVRELCGALELDEASTDTVVAAARGGDHGKHAELVSKYRHSDLRFPLITDITAMCFADGKVEKGEAELIARFAGDLGLNTSETVLIGRYVEDVLQGKEDESLAHDLARQLAAASGNEPHGGFLRRLFGRLRGRP